MENRKRLHSEHIANVSALEPLERVDYFVRESVEFEGVWGLVVGEDNWVTFVDVDGDTIFPVWPHEDLAVHGRMPEHDAMGAVAQQIPLDAFMDQCIPDMANNSVHFGVFYLSDGSGMAMVPEELNSQLLQEIAFRDE